MTWKNLEHSTSRTEFCGTPEQSSFKPPQTVTVREKPDEWDHAMDRSQNPTKVPRASSDVKPGFETAYFVNKAAECSCTRHDWRRWMSLAHRFSY